MQPSAGHREHLAQLGELTVGVAHELNNTVGCIGSNLDSLRRYGDSLIRLIGRVEHHLDDAAKVRWREELAAARWDTIRDDLGTLIEETRQGADHLRHVVSDLRIIARASPASEPASIDACVASALTVLAHHTKHRCVLDHRAAAPRLLTVVRSQMTQLALNLLLNAIQALPSNGGTVRVHTHDAGDHIRLSIEDSGPGIAPDIVERLFQPYVTTKATGTGLGLASARQIAATHGGDIAVDRSPDLGGARFIVTVRGIDTRRSETQGV